MDRNHLQKKYRHVDPPAPGTSMHPSQWSHRIQCILLRGIYVREHAWRGTDMSGSMQSGAPKFVRQSMTTTYRIYLVRCERSSAFLRRTFEPFSGGNATRCTSWSDTSLSCSPTPTLSTLPGAASTVLASCCGGACCSRFLTRPRINSSHCQLQHSCKPRFHGREHQEGST